MSRAPMVGDTRLDFELLHQTIDRSRVLRAIWRRALGSEYPEGVDPLSFLTKADLHATKKALSLGREHRLLDLACGAGGPGLHLARTTGAHVVGVDLSAAAIMRARQRAARMGLTRRARFLVGDIRATDFPSHTFSAIVCFDALQLIDAKRSVAAEVSRLLASEGRVVFTTWERPSGRNSLCRLLKGEGLEVRENREIRGWAARQFAVYKEIMCRGPQLFRELGAWAEALRDEARREPARLRRLGLRRVFVSAVARAGPGAQKASPFDAR